MNHAVISCLHANLAAVEAVLDDIDSQGITSVTCLGDLVGYGPQPNEVINLVRGRNIQTCQGCWDEDIIDGLNSCECSYPSQLAERRGHRAHEWTAEILTDENKQFLAKLPMTLRRGTMLFVHGSPNSQHEYLLPDMNAFAALERVETAGAETMMFCGHTHQPYVRELSGGSIRVRVQQKGMESASERSSSCRCAASLMQDPLENHAMDRLKQPTSCTTKRLELVTIREVDYDVDRTCRAILEVGLPEVFAWRLSHGFEYAERADDASHVCER